MKVDKDECSCMHDSIINYTCILHVAIHLAIVSNEPKHSTSIILMSSTNVDILLMFLPMSISQSIT